MILSLNNSKFKKAAQYGIMENRLTKILKESGFVKVPTPFFSEKWKNQSCVFTIDEEESKEKYTVTQYLDGFKGICSVFCLWENYNDCVNELSKFLNLIK